MSRQTSSAACARRIGAQGFASLVAVLLCGTLVALGVAGLRLLGEFTAGFLGLSGPVQEVAATWLAVVGCLAPAFLLPASRNPWRVGAAWSISIVRRLRVWAGRRCR